MFFLQEYGIKNPRKAGINEQQVWVNKQREWVNKLIVYDPISYSSRQLKGDFDFTPFICSFQSYVHLLGG